MYSPLSGLLGASFSCRWDTSALSAGVIEYIRRNSRNLDSLKSTFTAAHSAVHFSSLNKPILPFSRGVSQ